LWNSFILVARVAALLALVEATLPYLPGRFLAAWHTRSSEGERQVMQALHASIAPAHSAEAVPARRPAHLALPLVRGVGWSDWGDPAGVPQTLAQQGLRPDRATPDALAAVAGGDR
jgi:hypothetical protein